MIELRAARLCVPLTFLFLLAVIGQPPSAAAADDGWSVIVTPQVWFSHIPQNGFASSLGGSQIVTIAPTPQTFGPGSIQGRVVVDSEPTVALNPQWGGQIALQRGPWTLAAGAQYVSFGTTNDINTAQDSFALAQGLAFRVPKGTTITQEFIDTDRFDVELSLSYFLPDVIKDRLDINAGLGFKFIYATATRNFSNGITPPQTMITPNLSPTAFGYTVCPTGSFIVATCLKKLRVSEDDYYYGMTIPVSFNIHLTADKKLYLPINVSPFIGAEVRNDRGVVYDGNFVPAAGNSACPFSQANNVYNCFKINRLDGTSFAYGVTADAGVRYVFDNGIALYGGFRVQTIEGFNQYLAWGPLVNMSVRFGK